MTHKLMKHVLSVAVASACASFLTPVYAQEAGLLVWINGDKGYNGLQKVGDAFAKKTGVKVTVEHPEDAPNKFTQAAGAGKGPDIFCWPNDRIGEWAQSGLITPLEPSKKIKDEVDAAAWPPVTYQGKIWEYPLSVETIGLIYNKAMVKTPPKTFEEVVSMDKDLQKQGKHALLWAYNVPYFSWPFLSANGGYPFAPDGKGGYDPTKVGVNNEGAIKGAELISKLIKDGHMPKGVDYPQMEGEFHKGNIAMMISGPWAWDNIKKSKIDFGVAPLPEVAGKAPKGFVAVLGCAISSPSKQKDLAKEFLESSVLSLEGLKTINADVALGTPANKAFYTELSSNEHIHATMENVKRGVPMPNIPEMSKFWSAIQSALENVTNGRQAPKEALDAAAARIVGK